MDALLRASYRYGQTSPTVDLSLVCIHIEPAILMVCLVNRCDRTFINAVALHMRLGFEQADWRMSFAVRHLG
jgi:hypothetical protein